MERSLKIIPYVENSLTVLSFIETINEEYEKHPNHAPFNNGLIRFGFDSVITLPINYIPWQYCSVTYQISERLHKLADKNALRLKKELIFYFSKKDKTDFDLISEQIIERRFVDANFAQGLTFFVIPFKLLSEEFETLLYDRSQKIQPIFDSYFERERIASTSHFHNDDRLSYLDEMEAVLNSAPGHFAKLIIYSALDYFDIGKNHSSQSSNSYRIFNRYSGNAADINLLSIMLDNLRLLNPRLNIDPSLIISPTKKNYPRKKVFTFSDLSKKRKQSALPALNSDTSRNQSKSEEKTITCTPTIQPTLQDNRFSLPSFSYDFPKQDYLTPTMANPSDSPTFSSSSSLSQKTSENPYYGDVYIPPLGNNTSFDKANEKKDMSICLGGFKNNGIGIQKPFSHGHAGLGVEISAGSIAICTYFKVEFSAASITAVIEGLASALTTIGPVALALIAVVYSFDKHQEKKIKHVQKRLNRHLHKTNKELQSFQRLYVNHSEKETQINAKLQQAILDIQERQQYAYKNKSFTLVSHYEAKLTQLRQLELDNMASQAFNAQWNNLASKYENQSFAELQQKFDCISANLIISHMQGLELNVIRDEMVKIICADDVKKLRENSVLLQTGRNKTYVLEEVALPGGINPRHISGRHGHRKERSDQAHESMQTILYDYNNLCSAVARGTNPGEFEQLRQKVRDNLKRVKKELKAIKLKSDDINKNAADYYSQALKIIENNLYHPKEIFISSHYNLNELYHLSSFLNENENKSPDELITIARQITELQDLDKKNAYTAGLSRLVWKQIISPANDKPPQKLLDFIIAMSEIANLPKKLEENLKFIIANQNRDINFWLDKLEAMKQMDKAEVNKVENIVYEQQVQRLIVDHTQKRYNQGYFREAAEAFERLQKNYPERHFQEYIDNCRLRYEEQMLDPIVSSILGFFEKYLTRQKNDFWHKKKLQNGITLLKIPQLVGIDFPTIITQSIYSALKGKGKLYIDYINSKFFELRNSLLKDYLMNKHNLVLGLKIIRTYISSFRPSLPYEQLGLLIFQDALACSATIIPLWNQKWILPKAIDANMGFKVSSVINEIVCSASSYTHWYYASKGSDFESSFVYRVESGLKSVCNFIGSVFSFWLINRPLTVVFTIPTLVFSVSTLVIAGCELANTFSNGKSATNTALCAALKNIRTNNEQLRKLQENQSREAQALRDKIKQSYESIEKLLRDLYGKDGLIYDPSESLDMPFINEARFAHYFYSMKLAKNTNLTNLVGNDENIRFISNEYMIPVHMVTDPKLISEIIYFHLKSFLNTNSTDSFKGQYSKYKTVFNFNQKYENQRIDLVKMLLQIYISKLYSNSADSANLMNRLEYQYKEKKVDDWENLLDKNELNKEIENIMNAYSNSEAPTPGFFNSTRKLNNSAVQASQCDDSSQNLSHQKELDNPSIISEPMDERMMCCCLL